MKTYFQCCLFLCNILLVSPCCKGQQIKSETSSKTFEIKLDEYKVDRCLIDIFLSVVEADSAHLRFPPNFYYYQLQFSNMVTYRTMILTPSRWQKHLPKDCVGVIRLGEMYFLCMGNFPKDSLFQKAGKSIDISVHITPSLKYDSLDSRINWFDWEKSPTAIVGKFGLCAGPPIDLYINVGKKLEGVERPALRDVRRSTLVMSNGLSAVL